MAEFVIGPKPLKCGHSILGLDLITWTCWCGAKEPDPPRGLKEKRRSLVVSSVEAKRDLERAVELLHMLDNPEARHPDVAAFLDAYEDRKARGE